MPKILDGNKQILTSGYGTGLTNTQKLSRAWIQKPLVLSTEEVTGGNGSGNAVALSPTATVSLVATKANATHVSLVDGVEGQLKVIVHKTRAGSNDLVITPANFANGTTITSNSANRAIQLLFDGLNWQVVAGEITGTAEMVIA
tara:strand:+ start:952 stop:1383 length:432 start_codon:yes stop_codon:yes gene_type:complete